MMGFCNYGQYELFLEMAPVVEREVIVKNGIILRALGTGHSSIGEAFVRFASGGNPLRLFRFVPPHEGCRLALLWTTSVYARANR